MIGAFPPDPRPGARRVAAAAPAARRQGGSLAVLAAAAALAATVAPVAGPALPATGATPVAAAGSAPSTAPPLSYGKGLLALLRAQGYAIRRVWRRRLDAVAGMHGHRRPPARMRAEDARGVRHEHRR